MWYCPLELISRFIPEHWFGPHTVLYCCVAITFNQSENGNCTNLFFLSFDLPVWLHSGHNIFNVYRRDFSCSTIFRHFHLIFFSFLPIAKFYQNNQSKKFGLLSQLALSSQTKFFLKNPPKFRKKAEADQFAGSPDADLAAELDGEADTCERQSPIGQYEKCLSASLDCAISDLVSLDSQTEVEQGILPWEETQKSQGLELWCCFPLRASLSEALFLINFWDHK